MGKLKIPKRIPIDVMRKVLGDKRTEDFLTVAYGPKLMGTTGVKIQKQVYENLLAQLSGREGTAKYQMLPAVMRLYFIESPQAKGRVMVWIRKKLNGNGDGTTTEVAQAAVEIAHEAKKPTRRTAKRTTTRKRERARA